MPCFACRSGQVKATVGRETRTLISACTAGGVGGHLRRGMRKKKGDRQHCRFPPMILLVFTMQRQRIAAFDDETTARGNRWNQKPLGSFSVLRCPLVESITCLLSIETRLVNASRVSPVDTIYVFSPVVDSMIACGVEWVSERGKIVPSKRYGSIGRGGLHPNGRNRLLSIIVRLNASASKTAGVGGETSRRGAGNVSTATGSRGEGNRTRTTTTTASKSNAPAIQR